MSAAGSSDVASWCDQNDMSSIPVSEDGGVTGVSSGLEAARARKSGDMGQGPIDAVECLGTCQLRRRAPRLICR